MKAIIVHAPDEERALLEGVLSSHGCDHVESAGGASTARVEAWAEFDLVILDLARDPEGGVACGRDLRASRRDDPILIWGVVDSEPRAGAAAAAAIGCDAILVRPLQATLLKAQVACAERIHREREEQRRLRAALGFSEARFNALAEALADTVFEMDTTGNVTYLNPYAYEISGYTPADVTAGFDATQLVATEDRERARLNLARLLTGAPSTPHEYRARRKDGTTFPGVTRSTPIYVDGKLARVLGVIYDQTEQLKTQDALRVSDELFRLAFEMSPDALAITNLETGRIVDVNAGFTASSGFTREEAVGRTSLELNAWADPSVRTQIAGALREAGKVRNLETRFRIKSGDFHTGLVSVAAFSIGGTLHSLTTIRDIEELRSGEIERRQLEAKVQLSQKLESLGLLAGGIAHDFNNLLMGVVGNAELALDQLEPDSKARAHVEQTRELSLRGGDLTRQLLTYAGRGSVEVEPIDLNAMVRESLPLLQLSISKRAQLRLELAEPLASVKADAAQIQQVLVNLAINGSEALGENDGRITIATARSVGPTTATSRSWLPHPPPPEGLVLLEVRDTGCGMADETLERMFDPFFSTKFTGRGLGLAALLGIVRGHQGAVEVSSEPGHGTTARIFLPACCEPPSRHANPVEAPPFTRREVVLLVDDDRDVREVTQLMLERIGFGVVQATTGREALTRFAERGDEVSCVLLDMTMPEMDGAETLRRLRAQRPDLPVIVISGYPEYDIADRFAGVGSIAFLQKPFRRVKLLETLRALIQR